MSRLDLEREVLKLRQAIRSDRDAQSHSLCWYRPELWDLLPEKATPTPLVPPEAEFHKRCIAFRKSLDGAGTPLATVKVEMSDSPSIPLYFLMAAEKWDHEYARNALLHFIHQKYLEEPCLDFFKEQGWVEGTDIST